MNKDQNAAVQYLMGRNDQRDNLNNMERAQRRQERKQRLYGYTSKGNKLDIKRLDGKTFITVALLLTLLIELTGMGFEESMVAEALKQTDNNHEHALTLLLNNPELLRVNNEPKEEDMEPKIQQVMAMGFTNEEARGTLKKTFGNVEAAIDLLLKGEGVVDVPLTDGTLNSNIEELKTDLEENNNDDINASMEVDEEYERKKQDEEDFIQDVPKDEDAYLDIDLTDESRILEQYKALMN